MIMSNRLKNALNDTFEAAMDSGLKNATAYEQRAFKTLLKNIVSATIEEVRVKQNDHFFNFGNDIDSIVIE